MFGLGKKQVTHQDLAEGLYNFAVDFTELMANRELGSATSPYKGIDKQQFMHEWLVVMFWAMHRVQCGCDKERLMGLVHKTYFEACGLMGNRDAAGAEKNLIISRFNEYDKAFNPSDGAQQCILGGVIAKNILSQEKAVLNAMTSFETVTHVLLLMKEIKGICDQYKVVG